MPNDPDNLPPTTAAPEAHGNPTRQPTGRPTPQTSAPTRPRAPAVRKRDTSTPIPVVQRKAETTTRGHLARDGEAHLVLIGGDQWARCTSEHDAKLVRRLVLNGTDVTLDRVHHIGGRVFRFELAS
ncbi:hypothetical protein PPSIR1_06091 [Plesiocystis pacifica SIR-1]|uniref:Uncharacterized protein n=1 Tax=Plesiocystis pacifica SIR-1 TaxID=391625 RepID=A6G6U3_9BACT|nr:hypothetical protein [Plesiocystis pacifica]EDM78396.1 hypothetical protein PPSIR1_06091 [Plesiocystis pacifica SIR-1]